MTRGWRWNSHYLSHNWEWGCLGFPPHPPQGVPFGAAGVFLDAVKERRWRDLADIAPSVELPTSCQDYTYLVFLRAWAWWLELGGVYVKAKKKPPDVVPYSREAARGLWYGRVALAWDDDAKPHYLALTIHGYLSKPTAASYLFRHRKRQFRNPPAILRKDLVPYWRSLGPVCWAVLLECSLSLLRLGKFNPYGGLTAAARPLLFKETR